MIAAHHFRVQDLNVLNENNRLRVPCPEWGQVLELGNLPHPEFIEAGLGVQFNHRGESILGHHLPHDGLEPLNKFLQVLGSDFDPRGVLVTTELKEEISTPGQALKQVKIRYSPCRPFVHPAFKAEKDGGSVVSFHEPGSHDPDNSRMPVGRTKNDAAVIILDPA